MSKGKQMYHFTDGGLRNVWLENGYIVRETPYGKGVSFHDLEGLTKAICMALVKKPGKLTGAEFRYIRANMLLSQKSLGQMMGYTEQAVAKWEKSGKIPKAVEYFLRSLYIARNDGSKKICSVIETMNLIERMANTKIIIKESRNKWTSTFELLGDDESYALAA
jgi:putative transcriptional regulator